MKNYSLKDKIAQMLLVGIWNKEDIPKVIDLVSEHHIGGVILYKALYSNFDEFKDIINNFKKANKYDIPLTIAIDQESGRVNRLPSEFKRFEPLFDLAISNKVIDIYSKATGKVLSELGINMNFAPVLDLKLQKDTHAIGNRAMSSDPDIVTKNGRIICNNFKKYNVIGACKHFPGQGSVVLDSHIFLPYINDYEAIKNKDLLPFKTLIEDNSCDAVMVGHMLIKKKSPIKPTSISKRFIKSELRGKLKFDGLVITDELGMGSIRCFYGEYRSVINAYKAGNDIICIKYYNNYVENLLDKLSKKIDKKTIDNAFNRILKYKKAYQFNDKLVNKVDINYFNKCVDEVNKYINN